MKKIIILMISLVLLAPLAFTNNYGYDPEPDSVEPKYYDDAKVLRVKYTLGEAYVKRSYDDGFEEAAINLPIFEKDTAGTTDGRLEVYMGRLNYLRLDYDTEVVFDKVPALRKTDLSLKVIRGGIYLDVENLDYERDIEVQTPDCGIFLLDKGAYRINVNEEGRTEVYVYDGIAEIAGDNYSRNVRENQKVVMFNGQVKERPYYFYSTDKDDFDRWNQDRNSVVGYARYSSSQYLDSGYEEYEHELSRQGRWKYHDTYNTHIWIPYSVGVDWRPYYHGRWVWNPYYGHVWSSFDSWGFFTHHYGRWHWDPIYHWHWIPGYRWSPAWVSWFWDDYYYGWCPLSWWNRPVVVYNGYWHRNYSYRRGIPFHARSNTIIKKSHLAAPGIHRVALKKNAVGNISKKSLAFRGNSPNSRPVISKVDVINARGKKVVYKKNALVSTNKYKVMKTTTGMTTKVNKSPVYKYSGKKLAKEKISKYTKSPYSKSATVKSKSYKYSTSDDSSSYKPTKKYTGSSSSGYKSKSKYRSGSGSSSSSRSGSGSSSSSQYKSKIKKSSSKSSSSKSKSSSSRKSSGKKTIKKKKNEPAYSYKSSGNSSSYSYSSPYSSKSYSSRTYKKKPSSYNYSSKGRSSNKSYSSSNKSYKSPSRSSYNSSYKKPTKSYGSSSYRSSSQRSYKSYSKPSSSSYKSSHKSSYKSSGKSSSSYKSRPRSSSSSYRSSSKSSSSRSSSSHSKSSSSSYKKKSK